MRKYLTMKLVLSFIMSRSQGAVTRIEGTLLHGLRGVRMHEDLREAWQRIERGRELYEKLPLGSEAEAELWKGVTGALESWKREHSHVLSLLEGGMSEEACHYARGHARHSRLATESALVALMDLNLKSVSQSGARHGAHAGSEICADFYRHLFDEPLFATHHALTQGINQGGHSNEMVL